MVEPASPRYVVIRGPTTAVRLALPALGSVTFGKASGNDWCLDAPGIADEHVVLYLDQGVGLEALDPRTAFLVTNDRGRAGSTADHPGQKHRSRRWGLGADREPGAGGRTRSRS
jgi:hypothetical protein